MDVGLDPRFFVLGLGTPEAPGDGTIAANEDLDGLVDEALRQPELLGTDGYRRRLLLLDDLGPVLGRLADEAGRARREALAWRHHAEIVALAGEPTTAEAFLRRAVERVARQLEAAQAVFWTYDEADDSLEPRYGSAAVLGKPVPLAVFQEVVAARAPRTAAQPDVGGTLRTYVLAPVFEGDALAGVLQVVPPAPALDPATVDAVGAAAEAIAAGLRTARQFERLSFQASHDALTGLANRRTFEAFIEREIKLAERHGTALSVMVIDADHFKRYNDTYGHPAGDALLRALGARLAQVCRSTDFVARYGGEEFVVVLPHTDRAGAEVAAGKVLAGIRTMHEGVGLPGGPVTASIGVATYPADVFDARELFHAADQAMYRAKHEGRDRVCQAGA